MAVEAMTQAALVGAVEQVQDLPYSWPAAPDAHSTRAQGRGTCAGEHAGLREDLQHLGFSVRRLMVVGPLVPALWPDLQQRAAGLLEVYECLTVQTPWAGPLLLDVTWHPAAVQAGLAGSTAWTGESDMACAVPTQASYAVADEDFREQKELLRHRLYDVQQRALRDGRSGQQMGVTSGHVRSSGSRSGHGAPASAGFNTVKVSAGRVRSVIAEPAVAACSVGRMALAEPLRGEQCRAVAHRHPARQEHPGRSTDVHGVPCENGLPTTHTRAGRARKFTRAGRDPG